MSHAERKAVAVSGLTDFDEFDDHPEREDRDEEQAEKHSGRRPVALSCIDGIEEEENQSIGEGFIELRRMPRDGIHVGKDDRPGQVGRGAVNFRIEEISNSDEESAKGNRNDNAVEDPQVGLILPVSDVHIERAKNPDGCAVAREAASPDLEDLNRVCQVECRIVEQTMSQARANEGAENHMVHQAVEVFGGFSLQAEHPAHNEVAEDESDQKAQAVPAQDDGTDAEDLGVGTPMDLGDSKHK